MAKDQELPTFIKDLSAFFIVVLWEKAPSAGLRIFFPFFFL